MRLFGLGLLLVLAVVLGYFAALLFPSPPTGVDPEYWRSIMRRRRRQILRRLAGRRE